MAASTRVKNTVTAPRLDGHCSVYTTHWSAPSSNPGRDKIVVLHNVQRGSGANPASSGYRGCFGGPKSLGRGVSHSPVSSVEVKSEWSDTSFARVFVFMV